MMIVTGGDSLLELQVALNYVVDVELQCAENGFCIVRGVFRQRPPGPLPRIRLALPSLVAPSAIGGAIGRPLSRPISHPNTGGSPQPPRSEPLGGLNRAIVVLTRLKQARNKNAIEAAILNRVLDCD